MSSPAPPAAETPGQKAARERRERRQAKIAGEGALRLQAIAGLSGRPHAAASEGRPTSSSNASPSIKPTVDDDPDITDISEHHYEPRITPRQNQSNPFDNSGRSTSIPGMSLDQRQMPPQQGSEDPMMAMLQQMMGAGGGDPNGQLPPGMADIFSSFGMGGMGGGAGMPGMPQQQQQPLPSNSAYLWRIIHALFSFALAIYITTSTTFTGSKSARTASEFTNEGFGQKLFYLFATAEVVLQSSRFFIERGQLPPSGIMGTLAALLPPPYGGYVRVVGRYSVIYSTVVADAMVVVFVLGCMAWWNGGVIT
ncbi:hypothetical protein EJ08DRAFT_659356 [Tothia fuscella]|uniref:Uncharacterized protein n=1 Tax=Tothia fuscella TaxID=1048955 RepID=A0A9P4NUK9_9PEZI|nr:hypothetical protein EJ08DRAFT_659356 [Tothia fuscella]